MISFEAPSPPIDLINSIEPPLQKSPSLALNYFKFLGTHTIMSLVDSFDYFVCSCAVGFTDYLITLLNSIN